MHDRCNIRDDRMSLRDGAPYAAERELLKQLPERMDIMSMLESALKKDPNNEVGYFLTAAFSVAMEEMRIDIPALPSIIQDNWGDVTNLGETEAWESYRVREAHLQTIVPRSGYTVPFMKNKSTYNIYVLDRHASAAGCGLYSLKVISTD